MKILALAFAAILGNAQASIVTIGVTHNSSGYSYVTGQNGDPLSGTVYLTFDVSGQRQVVDYGNTTIVQYGFDNFNWMSSITIPTIPRADTGYVFPNVSDYDSVFIEEFAAQTNSFIPGAVNYTHHAEIRISKRTEPRSGVGLDDYAFTPELTLSFLQSAFEEQLPVYFNESFGAYTFDTTGSPVYTQGVSWSDYGARITHLEVSQVPEPSTLLLAAIGVVGIFYRTRR